MSKHTPGPWVFLEEGRTEEDSSHCRPLTICGPNADDLANVYSSDDTTVSIPRSEAIANARLIAAAPELLRVAELLVSWLDEEEGAHKLCDAARAAIRAAAADKQWPFTGCSGNYTVTDEDGED